MKNYFFARSPTEREEKINLFWSLTERGLRLLESTYHPIPLSVITHTYKLKNIYLYNTALSSSSWVLNRNWSTGKNPSNPSAFYPPKKEFMLFPETTIGLISLPNGFVRFKYLYIFGNPVIVDVCSCCKPNIKNSSGFPWFLKKNPTSEGKYIKIRKIFEFTII